MRLPLAALLLLVSVTPSAAEDCRETFIRLLTDQSDKGPVKVHVTQAIKGGPSTTNYNYQLGPGHWMTEMIEPAAGQWTLVYDNVMYSSTDKGKSWTEVRTLDSGQRAEDGQKHLEEAAATAANEACRDEEFDGVMHQVVEADYDYPQFGTKHHQVYWVNPETGWITKSVTTTVQSGFESTTTQLIEAAPDLELPMPE
ncbi:hypothetical protein V6C03_00685 [Methyloligella sp. 2.7D]|uniref:hypothetical protein n=1 Tax=unclassified Methyloligella TaxID=2625955 RepID=UPI00157D514E|nr:hypothetical protein [Methyloligella sp. GL2]QKP76814.1 hypothetical protein HT051_04730 [Methyloligella sp. GL2]